MNNSYQTTIDRLKKCKIWYDITSNYKEKEVFSCRDAVQVRDRLGSGGHGGVPLWTELKSQIYSYTNPQTQQYSFVVAHTRANTRFIEKSVLFALSLDDQYVELKPLESEKLENHEPQSKSPIFGLVNPFNIDLLLKDIGLLQKSEEITQIFDSSLLLHGGFPNTVITNAGSRSKAIEVFPNDLIDCVRKNFSEVYVADISEPDPIWLGIDGDYIKDEWIRFPPAKGPKIGILTGNSPESGLALWNDFLIQFRNIYSHLNDVLMPEVVVHSLPQMGLSMELIKREEQVWKAIKRAVTEMLHDDCKLITIACNTTIYFEPQIQELCNPFNARFVSIAEACLPEIKKQVGESSSSEEVGLVGIGPVIDFERGYSGYERQFRDHCISVTPCDAKSLAYLIKSVGTNKDGIKSIVEKFRKMMKDELPNAKVVVLSLTEISLVYREHIQTLSKKHTVRKIFIDPVDELSKYLVFLYLLQGLEESEVCMIPSDFNLESKLKEIVYGDRQENKT